jgi:hypothetical protein
MYVQYLQEFMHMVPNEGPPMVCLSLHVQKIKALGQGRKNWSISRLEFLLQKSLGCGYLPDLVDRQFCLLINLIDFICTYQCTNC